jgi:predicted dinucleotide-binding enzyme
MKIGILGAGRVGTGLGRRLADKGHDLVVSFSLTPGSLAEAVAFIGGSARAGAPEDAAAHGEVVILSSPWSETLTLVSSLADRLAGKILWDTTNPLKPDMSGLELGTSTSGGEAVSNAAPRARVVKAVAPFAQVLHSPTGLISGQRSDVFVCGDDPQARSRVATLLADVQADPVDAGPLQLARYTEPLGMLLVQLAYTQGFGAMIGAHLLREIDPSPPAA